MTNNINGQGPDFIWLQPWCDGCEKHACFGEGRMWCQDNVWDDCEECGRKAVKYALAPTSPEAG